MTLLVGYQNKDECFIVTDLLYTIRSKKRELEKLRRIRRDNNFFLAWTGQANRGWDTDIYNRHNKEDFLNGNLSIAGKSELTLKHRKIKETKIRLFKPPIGFLAVDINMPKVYHGEINNEGFRSLDPLDEERITMLGYHTDDCLKLIKSSRQIADDEKFLSVLERSVLKMGRMYPGKIAGLASYSIKKGSIKRVSYQSI